jgi:serine/threonine protein kinase
MPPSPPGATPVGMRPVTVPAPPLLPLPASTEAREVPYRAPALGGQLPLTKHCSSCDARYPADFLLCPRDATPLVDDEAQEDPLLGKLLGETYQIVRVVGEGGMGRVYEARHLRLKDRRFAVKVLHAELARQPEVVVRFQREAESASAITHDNVVDVFDVHRTVDGRPYMVGEFLEGIELGAYLDQAGKLEAAEAVRIARQICQALIAAHKSGIVHRDMKPENVFLVGEGPNKRVKVLDFGISKAAQRNTNLTRTGTIMGTPSYMAPEQARGEGVDHRADVYAVGATLYHLVTGSKPFDADDPGAILTAVLTEEPVRPRTIEPRIPEGLELVIQRAMAKDPRDRYQTMAELDQALASFDATSLARVLVDAPPSSSASVGLDATARTMFAGLAHTPTNAAPGAAKMARPTIVLVGGVVALWLTGGFVDALAGVVRYFHAGELTITESVLLILGSVFAAATPMVLFGLHVHKVVWPNSMRALQLAADLRRTATAALLTYGAAAFVMRVVFTVLLRDSHALAGGLYDAGLFLLSLVGAGIGGGLGPLARRARRQRNG